MIGIVSEIIGGRGSVIMGGVIMGGADRAVEFDDAFGFDAGCE